MKRIALISALVLLAVASTYAADWEWPAQTSVGGFQVSNIHGTVDATGSGTATGTLQIPNLGDSSVSLTRSSRGDISGKVSLDARISGGTLRGTLALSGNGLSGSGSLGCFSRSVENADMTINNRGEAKGSGKMSLGRLSVPVDFTASGSSCSLSGETPVAVQVDTVVATYKFDGRLSARTGNGTLAATVSGRVERTGKLSSQVTSFNIPSTAVDMSNGQCTVNVGGVSVTFSLF